MKRIPLYLSLAASLALGSAAFAQAPDGAAGQRQIPQTRSMPPGATSPAPSATQPSPTNPGMAPSGRSGASFDRGGRDTSGSVTINRRDRGDSFRGGVAVDRSDRFDGRRFDRGDRWRSRVVIRDRVRPAFAFISGPRVFVRPGWCRGMHRGWHSAPGIGPHAGTHRGLFRC